MTSAGPSGELQKIEVSSLRLDPYNPRFEPDQITEASTQEDIALYIEERFDCHQIAESIARHGFFASEPLIALRGSGSHVVLEGNRRLAALMGVASQELRLKYARFNRSWNSLVVRVQPPDRVPVLLVEGREQVAPLLGFRHISGIEPWDPAAQARYITNLVEIYGNTLTEVADLVGRSLTEVRTMYRNREILRQANEEFGLDTSRAEKNFGVFTAAMGRTNIRDYISAPAPREVDPDSWPMPEEAGTRAQSLLGYLFGDEDGAGRVITDSRQISKLASVLETPGGPGEEVLKATGDLDEAIEAGRDYAGEVLRHLNKAAQNLRKAESTATKSFDSAALRKLGEIKASTDRLLSVFADGMPRADD